MGSESGRYTIILSVRPGVKLPKLPAAPPPARRHCPPQRTAGADHHSNTRRECAKTDNGELEARNRRADGPITAS